MIDHFHVEKLANAAIDDVRRRVQQEPPGIGAARATRCTAESPWRSALLARAARKCWLRPCTCNQARESRDVLEIAHAIAEDGGYDFAWWRAPASVPAGVDTVWTRTRGRCEVSCLRPIGPACRDTVARTLLPRRSKRAW